MLSLNATFTKEPTAQVVQVKDVEYTVMNNRVAIPFGENRASFINVTAWGELAEYIGEHYSEGDEVLLDGEIRNSKYRLGDRSLWLNYILITNVRPIETADTADDNPGTEVESQEQTDEKPEADSGSADNSDDSE